MSINLTKRNRTDDDQPCEQRPVAHTASTSIARSYGQYCAVAKALDVVGDRWTGATNVVERLRGDNSSGPSS